MYFPGNSRLKWQNKPQFWGYRCFCLDQSWGSRKVGRRFKWTSQSNMPYGYTEGEGGRWMILNTPVWHFIPMATRQQVLLPSYLAEMIISWLVYMWSYILKKNCGEFLNLADENCCWFQSMKAHDSSKIRGKYETQKVVSRELHVLEPNQGSNASTIKNRSSINSSTCAYFQVIMYEYVVRICYTPLINCMEMSIKSKWEQTQWYS